MHRYSLQVAAFALLTTSLRAQSVTAYSAVGRAGTAERAALVGGGVTLGTRVSRGAFTLQLQGEVMRGSRDQLASICSGNVPPDVTLCNPRRLRTTTTFESGSIGVLAPVLHRARITFSLAGALGIVRIGTESRDSIGRAALAARRLMYVPEVGLDWRWRPSLRHPIGLTAGAAIGSIRPITEDRVADGYTPFNRELGLWRVWLGVNYAFDR